MIRGSLVAKLWAVNPVSAGANPALGPNILVGVMNQRIGSSYPYFQLQRALFREDKDKADKWRDLLAGMETGELTIGSRTPVTGMPAWATPEVIPGGFATGTFVAGGSLRAHEHSLANELGISFAEVGRIRAALNAWYLSDDGLKRLREVASSGCFDVEAPEEAALLAVALLIEMQPTAVQTILNEISPFFDRLRFYPIPTAVPRGDGVHVRTVGQLRQSLYHIKPSKNVLQQSATLTTWIPLYDRLTDLLSELHGEAWEEMAVRWTKDYSLADHQHVSRRWSKPDGPFQRCRQLLEKRLSGELLSIGDKNYISIVANRRAAKYGTRAERDAYRADQARQDIKVWFDALADVVLARIRDFDEKTGLENIDAALAPIAKAESRRGARTGAEITPNFRRKIMSARVAPVSDLIEGGQISSPEVLAAVLPQITSQVHASAFRGRSERAVFASLYQAFRQRRSLLLLDLQSQVRLEELPWASALLLQRSNSLSHEDVAREVLHHIVLLTLMHFPHVQFPNALVDEMTQLARQGNIDVPLTREIAADIFMGRFTRTFDRAATLCLERYHGKLYGCYYDLPARLPSMSLGAYCYQRAGQKDSRLWNWSVAANGMAIEQQLILTSHNLAAVLSSLDLPHLEFGSLAKRTFEWICARQQIQYEDWRAQLQVLKNAAYAWRQMIAYLSELEEHAQSAVWHEIEAQFSTQSAKFRHRFEPAMLGLREAIQGVPPSDRNGKLFLGWSVGRHDFASSNAFHSVSK